MAVRAKMVVSSLDKNKIRFDARYDDTIPEDQRFAKATPSGSLTMTIDNPSALGQFEVGKAYYLDFTLAE